MQPYDYPVVFYTKKRNYRFLSLFIFLSKSNSYTFTYLSLAFLFNNLSYHYFYKHSFTPLLLTYSTQITFSILLHLKHIFTAHLFLWHNSIPYPYIHCFYHPFSSFSYHYPQTFLHTSTTYFTQITFTIFHHLKQHIYSTSILMAYLSPFHVHIFHHFYHSFSSFSHHYYSFYYLS